LRGNPVRMWFSNWTICKRFLRSADSWALPSRDWSSLALGYSQECALVESWLWWESKLQSRLSQAHLHDLPPAEVGEALEGQCQDIGCSVDGEALAGWNLLLASVKKVKGKVRFMLWKTLCLCFLSKRTALNQKSLTRLVPSTRQTSNPPALNQGSYWGSNDQGRWSPTARTPPIAQATR
jgi:hypothetical protein